MVKKQILETVINQLPFIDGRNTDFKKAVKAGFSKDFIENSYKKKMKRYRDRIVKVTTHKERVEFLKILKQCEFAPNASRLNGFKETGDWCRYHRPSSNGKGWVLIAPDQPSNNVYIEDHIILNLLMRKYGNSI